MPRGKDFTTTELNEIKSFLKDGLSYEEIAELMCRTKKSIINLVSRQRWSRGRYMSDTINASSWDSILKAQETELPFAEDINTLVEVKKEEPKPVKEKTLFDFTPRQILHHVFGVLGYYIKGAGQLACKVEQIVNLDDIIKNG